MIETAPVTWSDAGQINGMTLPGCPADWSLAGSPSENESSGTVPFDIAEVPEPTVSGLVLVGSLALALDR